MGIVFETTKGMGIFFNGGKVITSLCAPVRKVLHTEMPAQVPRFQRAKSGGGDGKAESYNKS